MNFKKLLLIILIILTLNSCKEDKPKTYTLKYVVFYPGYSNTVEIKSKYYFYIDAGNGINIITEGGWMFNRKCFYKSTAPFKILNYTINE